MMMPKFYGYIQPKIGWLYDRSDEYWTRVANEETYDLTREATLAVIRNLNAGKKNPVVYVLSVRSHEEAYHARD